jgi:hypothetical protein
MKSTIFALFLGLATITSVMADEVLTAHTAQSVDVLKAKLVTKGDSELQTVIQVYASVQFSNECMAPDHLITTVVSRSHGNLQLILGGLNTEERMCPAVYKPVRRTVLVHTIYGDIMPVVTVNGRAANLQ